MKLATQIVDKFEYKGKVITVHKDGNLKYYFKYEEEGKEIVLSIDEIKKFIGSPFSHTTINDNVVDIIEKSVKINDFLFNLGDLENRLKKYN
tara:strand:- start:564 stop:839 length:276 start_codon:yes stop_codon:yes gene_type:complete